MAVANGFGKVATSGSVFMYDTGDTVNSYIGEPTTNYQWNSGYEVTPWTVGGINTDVTNTVDQGPIKGAKTWKFQKTGTSNQWNGWESSYGGIWTGNAGDIWTTSYWYKTTNDAGMGGFWVGSFYLPDWSRPYNATVLANVSSIIPDGQWHYNYTVTQINENYSNAIIVDGPSWGYSGNPGVLYINGLQWEKKSHPTPFAYGTRSATQGLLPIVGNSTIDLSSVSFDSNAQIYFDGTDDVIPISPSIIPSNQITIEFVCTNNNLGANNSIIAGGAGGNQDLSIHLPWGDGNVYWDCGRPFNRIYKATTLAERSGVHHWVFTKNPSTGVMNIYLDGNLWQTGTGLTSTMPSLSSVSLGRYDNGGFVGYYFPGTIPIAKIYNRELAPFEVTQNYNKYKTRFNLP